MKRSTVQAISFLFVAGLLWNQATPADQADIAAIEAQVAQQHDEGVQRLQEWIRLPSIAAENLNFPHKEADFFPGR